MDDAAVRLRPAAPDDLSDVETVLERNGLPAGDVRSKPAAFRVASAGDERVGVAGLEVLGTDGLLRSLVVEEAARGQGFGTAICDALEAEARGAGVETLYLLTTTAADFFARRGYETIERGEVPDPVRETTQFADLCPATATCLHTSL